MSDIHDALAGKSLAAYTAEVRDEAWREGYAAGRHAAGNEITAAIAEAAEKAWSAYLSGPGGTTEALRQGRFSGLNEAERIAHEVTR